MSYVFWCSRCKDRHAGECPPAAKPYASPYGPTSDPGPGPAGPHYPAIGSRWDASHDAGGNWKDGFYGVTVKKLLPGIVVCDIPGIGPDYEYPLGCWGPFGAVWNAPGLRGDGQVTKMRLRKP